MPSDNAPPSDATPTRFPDGRSASARTAAALETPLWALAAASMALDAALTAYGLRIGLTEANPLARRLIRAVGLVGAMALLKGAALLVGLAAWRRLPRPYRIVAPSGLALPWTIAVAVNAVAVLGAR